MTKQEKEYILKYESNIITAGKYDYTRRLPAPILSRIQEIYNDELGTSLNENFSCSSCIIRFLKLVYRNLYPKVKPNKENNERQ